MAFQVRGVKEKCHTRNKKNPQLRTAGFLYLRLKPRKRVLKRSCPSKLEVARSSHQTIAIFDNDFFTVQVDKTFVFKLSQMT